MDHTLAQLLDALEAYAHELRELRAENNNLKNQVAILTEAHARYQDNSAATKRVDG